MYAKHGAISFLPCRRRAPQRCVERVGRDERVGLPEPIGAVAGPAVVRRLLYHRRAHGIEFDVAHAFQQVGLGLDQGGLVPAIPQCAGAPVGGVDVLHIAPSEGNDQLGDRLGFLRGEQQMHMIGHQRVGVKHTPALLQRFSQPMQVSVVVFLCKKAGLAVVAALHDVQRHVVEVGARAARHGARLAEKASLAPLTPFNSMGAWPL